MLTHDAETIDRRIMLEAKCLAECGHKVTIFSPSNDVPDIVHENIHCIPIISVKKKKTLFQKLGKTVLYYFPSLFPKLRAWYLLLRKNNEWVYNDAFLTHTAKIDADIVFAHDLPVLPMACVVAEKNGCLLIYDSHEFYLGQKGLSRTELETLSASEAEYIQKTDRVITVNENIAELLQDKYKIPKPDVLYNSVDWTYNATTNSDYLHKHLKLSKDRKILLYQGGFLLFRNLEFLVLLAARLPDDFAIVLVGWGGLEFQLKKMARKMGIWKKRVFILPRVRYADLHLVTSSARAGIIPYLPVDLNTKLCTPNKLFEYIASGLPVLYHQELLSVQTIVEKYEIGIGIDLTNAQLASKEIVELFRDTDKLQLIKKNTERAHDDLSWSKQKYTLLKNVRLDCDSDVDSLSKKISG